MKLFSMKIKGVILCILYLAEILGVRFWRFARPYVKSPIFWIGGLLFSGIITYCSTRPEKLYAGQQVRIPSIFIGEIAIKSRHDGIFWEEDMYQIEYSIKGVNYSDYFPRSELEAVK